jgi:hypothetical protein
MRKLNQNYLKGLFVTCLAMVLSFAGVQGQILSKEIKEGTSVVTDPLKDTQRATKEITQPIKDVRKEVKSVTDAPKQVTREIDNTEKSIDQAGNEIDRAKNDVDKLTGKGGNNKGQDSTAAGTAKADDGKSQADGKTTTETNDRYVPADYVPEKKTQPAVTTTAPGVDASDVPRPVPAGSRDNKTPSGPMPVETAKATGGTDPSPTVDDPNDPAVDAANAANPSGERYVELSNSANNGEKRPRPDYSNSPARIALEKAEHDIETLEDLFKYSNWDGPEREHTVRAIEYALDELQQAIVEIKKMDPSHSTWRFEERYKEMRAAFSKAKQG